MRKNVKIMQVLCANLNIIYNFATILWAFYMSVILYRKLKLNFITINY